MSRYYDRDRDDWGYDYERGRYGREGAYGYGGPYGESGRMSYGGRTYGRGYGGYDYDRWAGDFGTRGYGGTYGRSGRGYAEDYERGYGGSRREGAYGEKSILVKLGDTDFDIADEDDIRGRSVLDQNGNKLGNVDDLIINQQQRRVHFLQVISGGFLGLGGTTLLIPVAAITGIGRDEIEIDASGGRGVSGARYNPTLIDRGAYGGYYTGPFSGYGYAGRSTAAGRYRGRGPRGYQRSDDRIREDVNDRLGDHPYLDAGDVEVSVNNGEVILNGTVNRRNEKRLAEDLAEQVSGVTNVENRLRVRQPEWTTAGTPAEGGMTQTTPATTATPATGRGKTTAT